MNKLGLENPKILIQPKNADTTKGKNVLTGEPHVAKVDAKAPSRKVEVEKSPDGKESLKITVRGPNSGGRAAKIKENLKTERIVKMKS